jgi:hypothetical protein
LLTLLHAPHSAKLNCNYITNLTDAAVATATAAAGASLTPQELIGSYTTIYSLPHWTLLILRQYNGLQFSTAINLANAALHF